MIQMNETYYAGLVIERVSLAIDKVFHYNIPDEIKDIIQVGMRVMVPFGHSNVPAYVYSLDKDIDIPLDKLKDIKKIIDPAPAFDADLIPLIDWIKEQYHCMLIEAIQCFVPPGTKVNLRAKTHRVIYLADNQEDVQASKVQRLNNNMKAILAALEDEDGIPAKELLANTGAAESTIKALVRKGLIKVELEPTYRNPWKYDLPRQELHEYNTEQKQAINTIVKIMQNGGGTVLLHGVTGSGKTEVYMAASEKAIEEGKQIIVLVPEISLTPQTLGRFKARFGDRVAVLHSRLSIGERYDEWKRIQRDEVDIVVGARSAVFAPLKRLGLIIIDESHEDSYKSDTRPRYHARDVAIKRCELVKGLVVLGSATPALDDYYKSLAGEYKLSTIKKRVENQSLPQVQIVDMRKELLMGNRTIFSSPLFTAISNNIENKEKTILLLNRRGYAQFVSCRSCGEAIKCNNCDISLTYHIQGRKLVCHYCGYEEQYPKTCPKCKSSYIKHFGLGTQKLEDEIKSFFPEAKVLRMDFDTTSRKGSHHEILEAFASGKYDILIGTQMVAKGLDFPEVTLVGVITADTSLNLPDYRSSEKTFQLITQVAGRAGRSHKPGNVIVQTYQPDHYSIILAAKHDYKGFYNKELAIRKQFDYPPFSHIIRVLLTGEREEELIAYAKDMLAWLNHKISKDPYLSHNLMDIGAYPAPIERIKNKYRWQILIRIRTSEESKHNYHLLAEKLLKQYNRDGINTALDFNPLSLM